MRHQIEVRAGQGSQPSGGNGSGGKASGKMSERVGRDATDIPVQDASSAQRGGSQQNMSGQQNAPGASKQGSGVGS
jgi:HSP20 family protein